MNNVSNRQLCVILSDSLKADISGSKNENAANFFIFVICFPLCQKPKAKLSSLVTNKYDVCQGSKLN